MSTGFCKKYNFCIFLWIYNNNVTTDTPVLHVLKGRLFMEFGIVGIKSLIGQRSKKSGKELNAYILHLVRDNPRDEGLQGHEVRQQFVDANLMAEDIKKLGGYSMLVGARIDLSYDEGGFVDSIRVLPNVPANK